jgi:hypothetical protein
MLIFDGQVQTYIIQSVRVGRLNTLAETYNSHWVVSRDMKKKKIDQYILFLME